LNSTYQQIQKSASPELRQALVKGQRAWISYRDAWCYYEELAPVAPGGNVNKAACLADVTISHTNRLKNSLADLIEFFVCGFIEDLSLHSLCLCARLRSRIYFSRV
jgi:hypothetical protein